MLNTAIASLAPLIVALAMWRGTRRVPVAAIERIEAKLDDVLSWQIKHERVHAARRGGQQ